MSPVPSSTGRGGVRTAGLSAILLALAALGLLNAASALASGFETVKHFAPETIPKPPPKKANEFPEDTQLGGVSGMAVNRTGAGGVEPGTLYAAGYDAGAWHVARFSPEGEFELGWRGPNRCGPKSGGGACLPVPDAPSSSIDVEVDQATGNVYVFAEPLSTELAIHVYNADGSVQITEFGEPDFNGTIAASPAKLHKAHSVGAIAVDDTGKVYVYDEDKEFKSRLAIFKPKTPGVFSEYEYGGEIINGSLGTNEPRRPVLDDAGNIYTAGEDYVEEYSAAGAKLCEFSFKKGGITSITVNSVTGEPFFFTYKDHLIHKLAACSGGKFAEEGTAPPFMPEPQRGNIEAMALNPELEWSEEEEPSPGVKVEIKHPAGTLYAGAAGRCPGIGSCPEEAQGQSSLGYVLARAASQGPVVETESVSGVGPTSATLRALVNPKGAQTSYKFQYLSEAAYQEAGESFAGAMEAPIGGAPLGAGQKPLSASATISGLTPGTAYRYRVIATSAEGSDEGEPASFATYPLEGGALPDGRAWELVSPAQKNGGEVLPSFPNAGSCGSECKPGLAAKRFPAIATDDGGAVAYQGSPFALNSGASEYDEYVSHRGPLGWSTTSLSPPLAGDSGASGFEAFGLNTALSEAIIDATNPTLTPQTLPGYGNLMREGVGNPLALAPFVVAPDPERRSTSGTNGWRIAYAGASADFTHQFFAANDALATAVGPLAKDGGVGKLNLYEWSAGQLRLVNVLPNGETFPGAVFGSGTALDEVAKATNPVDDFAGAISEDGSRVFWSSESGQAYVREDGESTFEIPDHVGRFLSASADGSKLLLSDGVLYDLEAKTSTDLTAGKGGFQGLTGQSEDLTHLYFVDTAVLDPTPNEFGDTAQAGQPNLYSWQGGAASYVTTLLANDNIVLGTWAAPPVRRSGEASPDGRWLAFGSKGEIFIYDSESGQLRCASCNPVGMARLGGSFLRLQGHAEGHLPQPRYLTDSGRLYFDSGDSLSALDTNNGVEDVYQFEPAGVGNCVEAGGCVDLVSSGRGGYDANFLATDAMGDNVFFTTRNQLLPVDTDQLIDLYDARVGGGIPTQSESPPAECQGEGCQRLVPPPLPESFPASQTFEGPGNATKKPGKHKKKHHKKKHHKKNKAGKKHKQSKSGRGGQT